MKTSDLIMDEASTLRVKHLPPELSDNDQIDLLKHFGAENVNVMSKTSRMKNTAFASFLDHTSATKALQRLHQLEVMGSILVAEYSTQTKHHPKVSENWKEAKIVDRKQGESERQKIRKALKSKEIESKAELAKRLDSVSHIWGCSYPINPQLMYLYPPPSESTLQNIANALSSMPKFYVQVLHLMNKMCLPAPFGPATARPPVVPSAPSDALPLVHRSSSESEIESEDEAAPRDLRPLKRPAPPSKKTSKRPKFSLSQLVPTEARASLPVVKPSEVFEESNVPVTKSFQFKLPEELAKEEMLEDQVEGGFGKLQPSSKEGREDGSEEEEEWGEAEFISSRRLRKGRLTDSELREYSVFKKYDSGEPTSRLYIKNLSKVVTEKDLHHIYGRYVHWEVEAERLMFDVRLMKEGRMKGQAFVTLPSASKAKEAVRDTHTFLLHDKPLVVQFARSAKPKDAESKKK